MTVKILVGMIVGNAAATLTFFLVRLVQLWHRLRIWFARTTLSFYNRPLESCCSNDLDCTDSEDNDSLASLRCDNVRDVYAFYTSPEGVQALDVTEQFCKAVQYITSTYRTSRDDMHICDLLTLQNKLGEPFFCLMHFQLGTIEMPSITRNVHYGIFVRHHDQELLEVFDNFDRPRLSLGVLDEDGDKRFVRAETPYQVSSVINAPPGAEQVVRSLFSPKNTYPKSLGVAVSIVGQEEAIGDASRVGTERFERNRERLKANGNRGDYELHALEDMMRTATLKGSDEKASYRMSVIDNTPAVHHVELQI